MADNAQPVPRTTGERPVSSTKEEVIREAKRIEETSLYSSKGHFYAAEISSKIHLWVGGAITILSAVATAFIFSDSHALGVGVLALVVTVLSGITTFLNPIEKANSYLTAGNNYDALCGKARVFWTIECWRENATEQILTEKLRDLSDEKHKLNQSCPQVPPWAYKVAKQRILAGEAQYEVDKTT
jgi:hypothetical protein